MNVSPSGLGLGGILECYSGCTPGGIRGKQGFNGETLDISPGMPSGLPLVHLHPTLVVEPGGMSTAHVLVRDRLSPTREAK